MLYCGDDVGDLPAFECIAEMRAQGVDAFSVLVGPGNQALSDVADVAVDTPAALVDLLWEIATH